MRRIFKICLIIAAMIMNLAGQAQQGNRENEQLAYNEPQHEVLYLSGVVSEIKVETCGHDNRPNRACMYLVVGAKRGHTLHLGPALAVSKYTKGLENGKKITALVFKTDNMPNNHYVIKEFTVDQQNRVIRDDKLVPVWSGSKGR